jgi:hypothetical protein
MVSKSKSIWRLGNAVAKFARILWLRSTLGSKIEFTCDIDGRPFRAYVRGPRSRPKPSAETIDRALEMAQARWDAANYPR